MSLVAFDARDAHVRLPHGSGIYARRLSEALRARGAFDLWFAERGGFGPELWFEQVRLPRELRRRGAALVHAPNCFLPLRRPCPGVVTVHDLAFHEYPEDFGVRTGWKYRTFTPRAARSAERVICVSEFTRRDVCERYGVDAARVRVIPEAPALAPGSQVPPAGPYLLSVGDLRPKKNLGVVVRAWRALRAEGLPHRLVLAGRDLGSGAELRSLAGGEPLELPGFAGDARVDALLRGADALVHAGLYEGFGLIVVEAMARGCPVVLARAGALPETGGDAAEYFDPHDAEALAGAIRGALERRAELSAAGRAHVAPLSWDETARRTEDVYRELL
ncbi:MAG TPA: glycosyltransferase family 1 protein [Solirubrobacteraceae bacterium]|nr:glycosyltransferase family 1 protein [Solirubrobacteraceae bacterium]